MSSVKSDTEPLLPSAISLSSCTTKSSWAFQRGNLNQGTDYTGSGQSWKQNGLMKQPDISDNRKLVPPQGLKGHRQVIVSPESEVEAIPRLGLPRTLDGGAVYWGAGTMQKMMLKTEGEGLWPVDQLVRVWS